MPPSLNPAGFRGRGVPDVAGDADPASGYNVRVDGQRFPIGGTSAVAPLWAALIARVNQKLGGYVGFINPQIYALAANSGFNDITVDDNKCSYHAHHNVGYAAGVGWDACTGLGTPIGAALANLLKVPAQEPPAAASRRVGVKRSGPRRLEAAGPASRPPRSAQHRRKLRAGRRHAGVNSPLKLSTETLVQAAPSQGFSTPSAPAVRRRRR